MTFTAGDKLAGIERELSYRRYVYPNQVAAGKKTQQEADRQIALMEAIAADYRVLVAKESPDLFERTNG